MGGRSECDGCGAGKRAEARRARRVEIEAAPEPYFSIRDSVGIIMTAWPPFQHESRAAGNFSLPWMEVGEKTEPFFLSYFYFFYGVFLLLCEGLE